MANAIIAQLIHLESESPELPINLYINSSGGSIPATLAIYDAMQYIQCDVETTCVGEAAATAAVLLAGGAPGKRQILPHGPVVIHAPAAEGRGAIPDLILEADEVERVRTMLEEILAAHAGRTPTQVREDTERDLILTPQRQRNTASSTSCLRAGATAKRPGRPGRGRETQVRRARRVTCSTDSPSAPHNAESISDDASLQPRSTSDRYCGETPARRATSAMRSPRSRRSTRSCSPTASRHSGSRSRATFRRSGRRCPCGHVSSPPSVTSDTFADGESPYICADSRPQLWCFFLGRDRIEHVSSSIVDRHGSARSAARTGGFRSRSIEVEQLSLIAQVEAEGLAFDLGAKNTPALLRDALQSVGAMRPVACGSLRRSRRGAR